jgi:predicted transcriptional regulator/anti-anti-sigma regulatory factor
MAEQTQEPQMKFLFESEEQIFSLLEESDFFRMKVDKSEVKEDHVEEFMDKTVEWLSTNPKKGILIDLEGVKSVCSDFTVALTRYYENIKRRGLYVRFVNVDPKIQPYVDVSNITVVMAIPDKPVISARQLLGDLTNNLSDTELMKKHNLSPRGLKRLYKKLLDKGQIFRRALARRMGLSTLEFTIACETKKAKKVTVAASDVMKNLANEMTNTELMRAYKLSPRGLQSLFRKLYNKGLISKTTFLRRKDSSGKISTSRH